MINILRRILDVLESPFRLARYALLIIEKRNEACWCCGYTPLQQIKHRRAGMKGICDDSCCVVVDARRFHHTHASLLARFHKEGE